MMRDFSTPRYTLSRRRALGLGGSAVAGAVVGLPALASAAAAAPSVAGNGLDDAFGAAATQHDVPRDLLVAIGYTETRLSNHGGQPSNANGYGIMHLVRNPKHHTLDEASAATGMSVAKLKGNDAANIAGAAAVLSDYAGELGLSAGSRKDVNAWYPAVAKYSGAKEDYVKALYADAVYQTLSRGATAAGVSVSPHGVDPDKSGIATKSGDVGILSTDYPPALWVPASSTNYTNSSRPSSYPINYVVIHTTQGSYAGTISWFQNSSSNVSAHYVIRSSDGQVTQMVRDADYAWHAGNRTYNQQSIGIEHEGFVNDASWYTEAMYQSSAAVTAHMCQKYGIPKTRSRIIAHSEVPGATHTDPGSNWNWSHYMDLVTGGGGEVTWQTTVDNTDAGFSASANWQNSSYSSQKYGDNYKFANPEAVSDPAWYSADLPSSGNYRVEVWYPALPGYNSATPYVVTTTGGNQTVKVDQRSGGGRWRNIGTFPMAAGNRQVVGVSRWTGTSGYVIADAVRISRIE